MSLIWNALIAVVIASALALLLIKVVEFIGNRIGQS